MVTTKALMKVVSILIMVGLLNTAVMAAVNVTIDRSPVRLNESFQLVFEADSSPDQDPDFSGLQQHFVVLNRSQSNNISIINGEYKRNIKWVLQVMPKQVGDFVIPAIPFGIDKTRPFQITVKPANQAGAGAQDGLIFDLAVDRPEVYVQGQVVVTMRLMIDRNISGYQMSDLKVRNLDVVIEPLGEVKQYQTRLADKDYLVLEKKIALFPQQSGKLEIEPVVAEVQISRRTQSLFGAFPDGSDIRRIGSQGVSIDVLTIASESSAPQWLPAIEVTLAEDWQGDITQLVAGEPVTRTITLVAQGLTSAQLPELTQSDVDGIKLYPDKALLHDEKSTSGIKGTRQQKIALIPTEAGIYTLPEITIDWWNVSTGESAQARIPSRTIEVKAGLYPGSSNNITDQQPISQGLIEASVPLAIDGAEKNSFWVWMSFVLALGWTATVLVWWYGKRRATDGKKIESDHVNIVGQREAMKRLSQSCTSNNARDTRDALLVWSNSLGLNQTVTNLNQLGLYFGDQLQIQITELNHSLYGGDVGLWKGDELLRSCESITVHVSESQRDDRPTNLCALNP